MDKLMPLNKNDDIELRIDSLGSRAGSGPVRGHGGVCTLRPSK